MWREAWPSQSIQNLNRSLDGLVLLVKNHGLKDDEVKAQLARFLVVRTAGYLEQVISESCRAYLISKSNRYSASFGISWLERSRNPSPDTLKKLVAKFNNSDWNDSLEQLLNNDDKYIHSELCFLIDRRNKIAHGESENVTVSKALDLVEPAINVAKWFISTFDPHIGSTD